MNDQTRSSTTSAEPTDHRPRRDLYATITNQIIAALETGEHSYTFPWHTVPGPPRNFVSGRAYRGINTLALWLTGHAQGYATPYWATFKQWAERGHPVRKGERATTVMVWNPRPTVANDTGPVDTTCADATTDPASPRHFLTKTYAVFNAAQVTGFTPPDCPALSEYERNAVAEHFFDYLPLTVRHGGDQALYHPLSDTIRLPPFAAFIDANAYYSVRSHESVHATGARHRLDRDLTGRFRSEPYAMEELIAELGAAFLCADLGLAPEPRPDHAAYVASWLKVLRDDIRAIFTAAAHAQRAVDWLHAQQPDPASATFLDPRPAFDKGIGPNLRLVTGPARVAHPNSGSPSVASTEPAPVPAANRP